MNEAWSRAVESGKTAAIASSCGIFYAVAFQFENPALRAIAIFGPVLMATVLSAGLAYRAPTWARRHRLRWAATAFTALVVLVVMALRFFGFAVAWTLLCFAAGSLTGVAIGVPMQTTKGGDRPRVE
jgi:hypothetical protein